MIINGNSLEELKKFPDNYFHSVVTDPPYGLSFMGKKWDYDVPSVELWKEVFRVLKEGGYLLSFAGTRTQHRMAVNIEDAGFEIRDMIAWVYGSGFPKSHNIGKAVDKLQGGEGFAESEVSLPLTKGTSEWEGWGTTLKPALEPITMARKPFKTTVAENVLKNGVGGINIDGCRVGTEEIISHMRTDTGIYGKYKGGEDTKHKGRFPANFIHDGSDEVKDLFPNVKGETVRVGRKSAGNYQASSFQIGITTKTGTKDSGSASRFFYCAKASKQDRNEGLEDFEDKVRKRHWAQMEGRKDFGKQVSSFPQKNNHPTV